LQTLILGSGVKVENVSDWRLIGLLVAAASLVSTAAIWLRFRREARLRPWMIRHVIGNILLTLGLLSVWFLDLAFFYYVPIVICIFVMWVWGTWKLRDAIQINK
jgi:hypothetical protein